MDRLHLPAEPSHKGRQIMRRGLPVAAIAFLLGCSSQDGLQREAATVGGGAASSTAGSNEVEVAEQHPFPVQAADPNGDRWMPTIGMDSLKKLTKDEILARRKSSLAATSSEPDPAFDLVVEAAAILFTGGSGAEAEALCDRAIAMDPDVDIGAYGNRGQARAAQGDFDGALEDLDRLIGERSSDVHYSWRARVFESMGRYEDAARDYDHAIATRDQAIWHGRKADACYLSGDFETALQHYTVVIDRYVAERMFAPQARLALGMRAAVHEKLGDSAKAAEDRTAAAKL